MEHETVNILTKLMNNDNPVVGLLAFIVVALSGVVVYQWRYTMTKTVPRWIWDNLMTKLDSILDIQQKTNIIIDERLKK
jgi:hypothetical protein